MMQATIDRFFHEDVAELTAKLMEFENKIEPLAYPENDHLLAELEAILTPGLLACRELDQRIADNAELRKTAQTQFRNATAPWCNQSWIINRARSKPRGFPGDYQMLLAIYDGVPIARGLGGYLDRLCLKMTLGRAVNARLRDAKSFLQDEFQHRRGKIDVLNIASGPGREYRTGLGHGVDGSVHVTCVDSDVGALEYIQRHVFNHSPETMHFDCVRYNALRLRSADAVIQQFGHQDIIYSVGLADYIPDRHLIPMLAGWKDALKPGGCVYVAFKDRHRYDPVEYQWLMDWHFLQRDEKDCLRLMELAGYDQRTLGVSRDATGVIVNFLSRNNSPAYSRLDPQGSFSRSATKADITTHM